MQSFMDVGSSLELTTAFVAKELRRYNIDNAVLTKCCLPYEGQVMEVGAGYMFYERGKQTEEDRIHGVGRAVSLSLADKLMALPKCANKCLMT